MHRDCERYFDRYLNKLTLSCSKFRFYSTYKTYMKVVRIVNLKQEKVLNIIMNVETKILGTTVTGWTRAL